MSARALAVTLALAETVCACPSRSSSGGAAPDAGPRDAASSAVPSPGLPEVHDQGGPVLASPPGMGVTFAGDPNAARVEALASKIGATDHWRSVATEYGIGPLTGLAPVHLTDAAPASIDSPGVQALLRQKLDGAHELGKPDAGVIYALVF